MPDGVVPNLSFSDYRAARGLNSSLLKHGLVSMKHLKYHIDHADKDSKPRQFGRAVHTALFEPKTFDDKYVVWDGHRRGKEWTEFEAAWDEREILTRDERDSVMGAVDSILSHKRAAQSLTNGQPEVSLFWREEKFGLDCKGRIDWLREDMIVDLKTANDVHWYAFGRAAYRFAYHLSLGMYRRACETLLGRRLPVEIICVENHPPYDVVCAPVDSAVVDFGESEAVRLFQQVSHCKKTGHWPGICDDDYQFYFPEWAMPDEDSTLIIGGEEVRV